MTDWDFPSQNQFSWIKELVINGPKHRGGVNIHSRALLDRLVEQHRWVEIVDDRYTANSRGFALVKLVLETIAQANDEKAYAQLVY